MTGPVKLNVLDDLQRLLAQMNQHKRVILCNNMDSGVIKKVLEHHQLKGLLEVAVADYVPAGRMIVIKPDTFWEPSQ